MMTPAAIGAAISELDGQAAENDAAFKACDAHPDIQAQWAAYLTGYQAFSARVHGYLSHNVIMALASAYLTAADLASLGDEIASYQASMNQWTDTANAQCGSSLPKTTPGPGLAGGAVTTLQQTTQSIVTLAIVAGAAYLAYMFLPMKRRR